MSNAEMKPVINESPAIKLSKYGLLASASALILVMAFNIPKKDNETYKQQPQKYLPKKATPVKGIDMRETFRTTENGIVNLVESVRLTVKQEKKSIELFLYAANRVTPAQALAWEEVKNCEQPEDPTWSDLGIKPGSWVQYGGLKYAQHGADAAYIEQVDIAQNIQHGYKIPDQNGICEDW